MTARQRILVEHPFLLVPPALYLFTVAPTIGFGDTAILIDAIQRRVVTAHVNNHPLTVLAGIVLGALLPLDDLALRANLVSALFGSLAVTGFYWIVHREVGSRTTATAAAAALAVSHSMWWHSTVVENYAASAFLFVVALGLWQRLDRTGEGRWLYALCAVGGLSVLNHVQMSFVCVGIAVTGLLHAAARVSGRGKVIAACGLGATVGLLPWLVLVLRDAARVGSMAVALRGAFVGSFAGTFFSGQALPSLLDTAYLFWFQSPAFPTAILAAWGVGATLRRAPRNPRAWGLVTAFLLNTATFAFYATWDKFAFLLVSFVNCFFLASLGLHDLLTRLEARPWARRAILAWAALAVVVAAGLYGSIASWARDPGSIWHARYGNRYSENLYFQSEFVVNPSKRGYREVERFATLLFEKLPPGAIFLDDDSRTYYPLADYYQRYYHRRPDVSVVLTNSWGIPDWGLGADAVAALMVRAFHLDKPFFTATLQAPTAQLVAQARRHAPIEFARFDLEPGRWVYRLIPSSERRPAGVPGPGPESLSGFEPLRLDGPAGYLDLSLRHVLFAVLAEPVMQDMRPFGRGWHGDDQLFLGSSRPGGSVELALRSAEGGRLALALYLTAAPDFGVLEVEVGGLTARIDLYDPSVQPLTYRLPEVTVAPGLTRMVIRIADKNPRSSGYKAGLDGLGFRRLGR
jgi:hypothetical protein